MQDTVTLSITEAEYITTVETSKEALWMGELIGIFEIIQDSVQIYRDSQSAIHLTKDYRYHKRTKHIEVRYHKIRQWVMDEMVIDLVKTSKKKNPADMMTKTIPVKKFRASLNFIKIFQR